MKEYIFLGILVAIFFSSCGTADEAPPNPFDGIPPDTVAVQPPPDIDANSIVGLHYNIFSPTCANSGCHDGTFEPDFRTVESTYNTLVNHPIVKNNPQGFFTYRVVPGDAEKSVLWERLNRDIDGQSGIMPLALEPDSDWPSNKAGYLENIKTWINGGAKDIFGNSPVNGNLQPSMRGVIAFANGSSSLLGRDAETGPVKVPAGTNSLEIWISLTDDTTNPQDLQHNKARFSTDINGFESAPDATLQIVSAITKKGYFGGQVDYYHKITINPTTYTTSGNRLFMRVYVKDPALSDNTEIPSDGSANYMKEYFSFIIN